MNRLWLYASSLASIRAAVIHSRCIPLYLDTRIDYFRFHQAYSKAAVRFVVNGLCGAGAGKGRRY